MSRVLIVALVASSISIVACSAAPETVEDADVESASEALANTGGGGGAGLTAAECTGCGCTLVFVDKTDTCRHYKCVCETESQANCAGSKAATITVPNPPRKVMTGSVAGSVLASPR